MKITKFEAIPVEIPFAPIKKAFGIGPYVSGIDALEGTRRTLIRLQTDTNHVGWGELFTPLSPGTTKKLLEEDLAPTLIGERVWDIESFHDRFEIHYLENKLDMFAGGVEIALWDLIGKRLEVPVVDLIGGRYRDSIQFAFCLGMTDLDVAENKAIIAHETGFGSLKTKSNATESVEALAERLQVMSDAVNGALSFRVDPNQSWSIEHTLAVATELANRDIDIEYLEQPIETANFDAYRMLRQRTSIPIGVNEDLYFRKHILQLIKRDAVDVGVVDLVPAGGLFAAKRLTGIAREASVSLAHHCGADLGVKTAAVLHLVASTPAINMASDSMYYGMDDWVLETPFEFSNGGIDVPEEPGLGIDVDMEKVERYRID